MSNARAAVEQLRIADGHLASGGSFLGAADQTANDAKYDAIGVVGQLELAAQGLHHLVADKARDVGDNCIKGGEEIASAGRSVAAALGSEHTLVAQSASIEIELIDPAKIAFAAAAIAVETATALVLKAKSAVEAAQDHLDDAGNMAKDARLAAIGYANDVQEVANAMERAINPEA